MIKAYFNMLRNWKNFSGRATRSDYWWAILANFIVASCIGVLTGVISGILTIISEDLAALATIILGGISTVYGLMVLVPGIALVIRRLHDINKSGWWYVICLALSGCCGIGGILFIVYMCMDGTPGNNNYGPDPKGRAGVNPMNMDTQFNGQYNNVNGQLNNQYNGQNNVNGQANGYNNMNQNNQYNDQNNGY